MYKLTSSFSVLWNYLLSMNLFSGTQFLPQHVLNLEAVCCSYYNVIKLKHDTLKTVCSAVCSAHFVMH